MGSLFTFVMKRFSIFFLLISLSLLSTSFAGGRTKFVSTFAADHMDAANQEETSSSWDIDEEEERMIHERVLRANRRDYGRYDPSPTLSKPPFKLIPN